MTYNFQDLENSDVTSELDLEKTTNINYCGERKLLIGILERAILDLSSDDLKIKTTAQEWFDAPIEDAPYLFSYQNICMEFNFSQEDLRKAILAKVTK
jgi:hypothetical protein